MKLQIKCEMCCKSKTNLAAIYLNTLSALLLVKLFFILFVFFTFLLNFACISHPQIDKNNTIG